MTSKQILHCMSLIDDEFIREAAPADKGKKRPVVWLRTAVAACLCLVCAGAVLWQAIKPVQVSAFEIEDGVLLAYHGTDAEVVIPDEVTKIAASAFAAAPSPDSITSLHIGVNVAEIEEDALAPLTELDTVTVAEENEFFEVVDGVLARKDGTVKVDGQRPYADSMDALVDVVSQITLGDIDLGEELKITFGKAEISVVVEENPDFAVGEDFRQYNCYITAIDFDGAHLTLEKGAPIIANGQLELFQDEDIFIYYRGSEGWGDTYLLADGTVHDISFVSSKPSTFAEEANETIIKYGMDENGSITYTRRPAKYIFAGGWWDPVKYCTGLDELCKEEGYVSWDGEKLVYTPVATYTVGESIDNLDMFFEQYRSANERLLASGYTQEQLEQMGRCVCNTLDELLAFNKKHYESWK